MSEQLATQGQPNVAESIASDLDADPEHVRLVQRLIAAEQAARDGDPDAIGQLTELHGQRLDLAERIALDLGFEHGLLADTTDQSVAELASAMLSMPATSDLQRVRSLAAALRVALTSIGP